MAQVLEARGNPEQDTNRQPLAVMVATGAHQALVAGREYILGLVLAAVRLHQDSLTSHGWLQGQDTVHLDKRKTL
jgi:hypothetical protein